MTSLDAQGKALYYYVSIVGNKIASYVNSIYSQKQWISSFKSTEYLLLVPQPFETFREHCESREINHLLAQFFEDDKVEDLQYGTFLF